MDTTDSWRSHLRAGEVKEAFELDWDIEAAVRQLTKLRKKPRDRITPHLIRKQEDELLLLRAKRFRIMNRAVKRQIRAREKNNQSRHGRSKHATSRSALAK
jgi:hypothetical protein